MYIAPGQSKLKVLVQYRQRGLGWGVHARGEESCGRDGFSRFVGLVVSRVRGDAGDGNCCCREGSLPLLPSHTPSPAVARATGLR